VSELGPVITGVILVGRSCSAIAVDLGNTKVRGEIEPLEYLGIDVDDYFVVPRIVCMIISQVTLALYFSIIMILCGVFFSAYRAKFTHYQAGKNGSEITGTSDSMHDINELGGDANAG
jgi:phospholipid/cholesterol/gamma-HCH transport system permease protein